MHMIKKYKALVMAFWILAPLIGIALLMIPSFINYAYLKCYSSRITPNTMFSASDWLLFYGSFLAFIGTTILGISTLIQNKRLHDRNIQIEDKNNNIQLLLAQEMAPFISIEELSFDEISSKPKGNAKINCINKTTLENGFTKYTIIIVHNKNTVENQFLFPVRYYLKNSSKSKINELAITSIALDKLLPNRKGNPQYTLVNNEIDRAFNAIHHFILPNEQLAFQLNILCDSDYCEIIKDRLFRIQIGLKTKIITGPEYFETIKLEKFGNMQLPVQYEFSDKPLSIG